MIFRQFQKSKLKHANSVVIRDSLRNEVSTQQMTSEELKEQMEQQVNSFIRLFSCVMIRELI